MAGYQTVWCIDAGKSSLKAVKLTRDQNSVEIIAVEKIDFAQGEETVDSLGPARGALRTFASRNVIDCPVIVVHPSRTAFSRFIQLPPVDGKKLQELVGYEAQQSIPFPIDEVIWDSHICDLEDSPEKEVGIFAVRREALDDFLLDYEGSDLNVDGITVGYVGLLNYILYDIRPTRPIVALDIGADHTDLVIVNGGSFWFRNLPIAGKDFTKVLEERFGISNSEAEELKVSAARTEHAAKVFQVLQPLIRDLVSEINRSIGFYKSQAGDVKFEDLFLLGNGAKLLGLRKFLQENLRIRVHVGSSFNRIRVSRDANTTLIQQDFPAFAPCVGGALQGIGQSECTINLLPQEQQEALKFKKKQKTVLIAAASLYLLVFFLWANYSGRLEDANQALAETTQVGELDSNKKILQDLEREGQEKLSRRQQELVSQGEDRLMPHIALEIMSTVFSGFNGVETIEERVKNDDSKAQARGDLEARMEEINATKTWLTHFDIERVRVKQDGKVLGKSESPKDGDVISYCYRVVLRGMMYNQGDSTTNNEQIKKRVLGPIERELVVQFGSGAVVGDLVSQNVLPGEETTRLYTKPMKSSFKDKSRPQDKGKDHGTTFYEFEVTWLMPPLKAEEPSGEGADE